MVVDESANSVFQLFGGKMHGATKLFLREQGKPVFCQVEPVGRSRREVRVETRSFQGSCGTPPNDTGVDLADQLTGLSVQLANELVVPS
jgi:hypothetical protein